jgi:hypothetical protein
VAILRGGVRGRDARPRRTPGLDDLLTTSRLEHGRTAPATSPLALHPVCAEALVLHSEFTVTLAGDPAAEGMIEADHFRRIVLNPVENAHRYGAPPVEITRRDARGTGLGLAIVKGLAELNRGHARYPPARTVARSSRCGCPVDRPDLPAQGVQRDGRRGGDVERVDVR